jgi:2-oxoglutarate ferredoxin oxidoreductase subunit alpha
MRYSWKIGGPAGYGIKSAGEIFAKAFLKKGLFVFCYSEYPSLIRGGHNTVQVDISDKLIRSASDKVSFLVALDEETIKVDREHIRERGMMIFDGSFVTNKRKIPRKHTFSVPFGDLAKEAGNLLLRNTVALGASLAFFGTDAKELKEIVKESFSGKEEEMIRQNIKAVDLGFHYVINHHKVTANEFFDKEVIDKKDILITGNTTMAMGAVVGGCKFFAAYPMTPSTGLFQYLIAHERDYDMVVHQGEDEIGVIHEALGASFAGARSMITTSGGGFALMTEAVSLSGMTETPIVIAEVMRPAPATGLPTWTDQGDLSFVLNAGHGDFPKVVLAAGDPEEAYELVQRALNFSEKFQIPVIILSDKFLGESQYTVSSEKLSEIKIKAERGKFLEKISENYKRYRNTKDGISPRVFPGAEKGEHIANSDEHDEFSFSVEAYNHDRVMQMNKRARKIQAIKKDIKLPAVFGKKDADITIISWGSNKGPILDALDSINYSSPITKKSINFIHFTDIYPFAKGAEKLLKKSKKLILMECNQSGQFGKLIRQETGIRIQDKFLKYDGRPFWPEEIVAYLKKLPLANIKKILWKKN